MGKKGIFLLFLFGFLLFSISLISAVTTKDVIILNISYINTTLYSKYHLTAMYPYGITTNATETSSPDTFYLTDAYNNAIWELNGTLENRTTKHSVSSFSGNPEEIGTNGTDFWFNDKSDSKVYHLNSTFNNQSGMPLASSDGLTVNGSNIFIQRYGKNYISTYDYSMNLLYNITCSIADTCYYSRSVYQYNNKYFYIMYGGVTTGLNFLRKVNLDGTVSDIRYNITSIGVVNPTDLVSFTMSDDNHFWIIKYNADGGQLYHILLEDTDAPAFTTIPANASLNYGTNLSVTFVATDDIGVDSFSVNDSRFAINISGILTNVNTLAIGNYELNVSVNDSTGNVNWTIYTLQINKSSEKCQVLFNETSPFEYNQTFKVWANCTSAFVLARNGTTITNNSEQRLSPSAYNFSVSRNDSSNYTYYYNETQFIVKDTISPVLNIISPLDAESFTTNIIDLNFSAVDDGIGLDKCWYQNNTGNNKTISCTANTTISQAGDGTYTIYMWANDSYGNTATQSRIWTVSANAPAINLNNPSDKKYFNTLQNILLNFTATDSNNISMCQLWGNFTGTWEKNQTLYNIVDSGTLANFAVLNFNQDGSYIWNVWCNDSTGLPNTGAWATLNRTFTLDTTLPQIDFLTANESSYTSLSVTINFTVNEINKDTCTFVLRNGTGDVHNYVANTSLDCSLSSIAVSTLDYGSFTFQLWATDKAGNVNQSIFSFSSSAPVIPPTTTGGGGGNQEEEVEKIPVIGLIRPNNTAYSELDMEIFYAEINSKCSLIKENRELAIYDYSGDCSLTIQDLKDIATKLATEGVSIKEEDLIILFKQYNSKELFQGYETKETITKWKLFTSVLGIPNPIFINPPSWRGIVILTDLDDTTPKQVSKIFIVNKNLAECNIIEDSGNNLTCDILTPTTFKVTYTLNDTNFFDKILDGEISVTTNATSENIEVRPVPVSVKVYNINYNIGGMPFWFIGGFTIFLIFGTFLVSFGPKKIRLIGKKRIKRRKG